MLFLEDLRTYLHHSLTQGLILLFLTIFGLGIGQGFLPSFTPQITFYFSLGLFLGIPFSLYIWKKFYPRFNLPFWLWILEAFLVSSSVWKSSNIISLFQGVLCTSLLFHLFLIFNKENLAYLLKIISLSFFIGGIIYWSFSSFLPFPLPLILLTIALSAWKIPSPARSIYITPKLGLNRYTLISFLFFLIFNLFNRLLGLSSENSLFNHLFIFFFLCGILISLFIRTLSSHFHFILSFILLSISCLFYEFFDFNIFSSLLGLPHGLFFCHFFSLLFSSPNISGSFVLFSVLPLSIIIRPYLITHHIFFSPKFLLFYCIVLGIILYISFRKLLLEKEIKHTVALPIFTESNPIEKFSTNEFSNNNFVYISRIETNENTKNIVKDDDYRLEFKENITYKLGLTSRETEVFFLLLEGKKLKEIAQELNLAIGTVKAHSSRIYEKAGVKGKEELIIKFQKLTQLSSTLTKH